MYNLLPLFLYLVIKYCEKVYERSGKNYFGLLKTQVIAKLKARDFNATSLSIYDFLLFSLLYLTI